MSYTTILKIYLNDKIECIGDELRNSHGSAPVVWDAMGNRYFGDHYYMLGHSKEFWRLYKDTTIPHHHRAVFMMTFDRAYISRRDYARAADDIDRFFADFRQDVSRVNHWPAIAEVLREQDKSETRDDVGIGFWMTSVGDNPFHGDWNEEAEEYGPPDWDEVYSLYDELDALETVDNP